MSVKIRVLWSSILSSATLHLRCTASMLRLPALLVRILCFVSGSYLDVLNSYLYAVRIALCWSARLPLWRSGFPAGTCQSSRGWRWPWSSLSKVVTPIWSVLLDSEYTDLQLAVSHVNIQGWTWLNDLQVLFGLHPSAGHVCSWCCDLMVDPETPAP